jgi:hypothetical protein
MEQVYAALFDETGLDLFEAVTATRAALKRKSMQLRMTELGNN